MAARALLVVSTDKLDELVASSPVPLGEIVTFVRGERSWRLTVLRTGICRKAGRCRPLSNGPPPALQHGLTGAGRH